MLAERRKVVQERRVVQSESFRHLTQVFRKVFDISSPELANVEEFTTFLVQLLNPFIREAAGKVLHSVQAETLEANLLGYPLAPVLDIITDFRVRVVQVGKHEEVCIAVLIVYARTPSLVLTLNLEDCVAIILCIVVGTGEMVPVVLLLRVFVATAWELEA